MDDILQLLLSESTDLVAKHQENKVSVGKKSIEPPAQSSKRISEFVNEKFFQD